jgi:hypothetical protein
VIVIFFGCAFVRTGSHRGFVATPLKIAAAIPQNGEAQFEITASIGNGEVDSSILSGSTNSFSKIRHFLVQDNPATADGWHLLTEIQAASPVTSARKGAVRPREPSSGTC